MVTAFRLRKSGLAFSLVIACILSLPGMALMADEANATWGQCADDSIFEFKPQAERLVRHQYNRVQSYKVIDANGNFIEPDRDRISLLPFAGSAGGSGFQMEAVWIMNQIPIVNMPARENELVYEFRSGGLVKGRLTDNGNFVPAVGSKVISFKDYRYDKDLLRIYNLPGIFVKKTKTQE